MEANGKNADLGMNERFRVFIGHVSKSQREFARIIGEAPANINNWCKRTVIPVTALVSVIKVYPELNVRWLLLDESPMMLVSEEEAKDGELVASMVAKFIKEKAPEKGITFDYLEVGEHPDGLKFEARGIVRTKQPPQ